jgi:glutamate--cysteine ligase
MSTRQDGGFSPLIGSRDELIAFIASGAKPKASWRIGTEHEKIPFLTDTLAPVPYEGPRGIRALMEGLIDQFGWVPINEGDTVVALKRPEGQGTETVSLEPGGQFELSGAPLPNVHETAEETDRHIAEVCTVGGRLGIDFLGLGFSPTWTLAETPRMPKQRYGIMTRYMPTVGTMGLNMMYRTATIQLNLDFADEANMVAKLRASLALQPIVTALFAASPFKEGKLNGFLSLRSEIWRQTDPARTGMLPFAFESGMGFEAYADYALDVPMYFVYRDGRFLDVAGASFRDFMAGRLPVLPGERPTIDDWSDHLTTLFPEVRLKRFLEMRGADGGRREDIVGLAALWVGLLYDGTALDAALELTRAWTEEDRQLLRETVPRLGFKATVRGRPVLDVARDMVDIARAGLIRRAIAGKGGRDESIHLEPIAERAAEGRSRADELIDLYQGPWQQSVDPSFSAYSFNGGAE